MSGKGDYMTRGDRYEPVATGGKTGAMGRPIKGRLRDPAEGEFAVKRSVTQGHCPWLGCAVAVTFDQSPYRYFVRDAKTWECDLDPGYTAQTLTITHGAHQRTFSWAERCGGQAARWLDQIHREEEGA